MGKRELSKQMRFGQITKSQSLKSVYHALLCRGWRNNTVAMHFTPGVFTCASALAHNVHVSQSLTSEGLRK